MKNDYLRTAGNFGKLIKYLAAGILNHTICTSVFLILTELLKIFYVISNTIVALIYLIVSFMMNNYWVFASRASVSILKKFKKFFVLYLINHVLDTLFLLLFTEIIGMKYIISKGICIVLITSWNFIINKNYIFFINPRFSIYKDNDVNQEHNFTDNNQTGEKK